MELEFKRFLVAFVVIDLPRHTMDSRSFWSCVHGHLRTEGARKCFSSTWLRTTYFYILERNGGSIFVVMSLNRVISTASVKPLLHAVTGFSSFVPFLDVEVHAGPLGCEKGSSSSYKSEWISFLLKSEGGDKLAECCWALCGCRSWMLLQAFPLTVPALLSIWNRYG